MKADQTNIFKQQINIYCREHLGKEEFYAGFLRDYEAVKKMWRTRDLSIQAILNRGIQTRPELCFVIERIARGTTDRNIAVEKAYGLIKAFEKLFLLEIKNINWFIEDLYRGFIPFQIIKGSPLVKDRLPDGNYEEALKKDIRFGIQALSTNIRFNKTEIRAIQESLFLVILTADFAIPESFFPELTLLLRGWIKPPRKLFCLIQSVLSHLKGGR
ncbi:MAG TPA: hypothetical protein VN944_09330 [Nitrospiria bacterium]|nr:hypothetical protein [Nitrospiria bacterium]